MTYEEIITRLTAEGITPTMFRDGYRRGTTIAVDGLAEWIGPVKMHYASADDERQRLIFNLEAHDVYLLLQQKLVRIRASQYGMLFANEQLQYEEWDEGYYARWVNDPVGFTQVWPHEIVIRQIHYRPTPPVGNESSETP